MDLLFPIAGLILLVGIPVYLHAVVKLSNIVQAEHPEWVNRRGSLSFFYTGMPRVADPNVGSAVLGVAFSSRWRSLSSPSASKYVSRIRILLPLLLVVFGLVLVAIAVLKP
jgi:hypothetical protein